MLKQILLFIVFALCGMAMLGCGAKLETKIRPISPQTQAKAFGGVNKTLLHHCNAVKEAPPLHCAVVFGDTADIQQLIADGHDINELPENGFTPLGSGALYGRVEAVKVLLKAGAVVNQANERGVTALHLATAKGHHFVVVALIKAGADVSLKTNKGETAADIAEMVHGKDGGITLLLREYENR